MYVNYNGVLRPMGFPMPLYFFMSGNRKISTDQLTNNLKRIVQMYVNSIVAENNRLPNSKRDSNDKLRKTVRTDVAAAVTKVLDDIKLEGVSISTTSSTSTTSTGTGTGPSTASVGVGTKVKTDSKLFNLGSYVQDLNTELNQMINDGIPL